MKLFNIVWGCVTVLLCLALFAGKDALWFTRKHFQGTSKKVVRYNPPATTATKTTTTTTTTPTTIADENQSSTNHMLRIRPPLYKILMDVQQNVTNDYIDSILQFAILGFAKTSTTHHLRLLGKHPEIHTIPMEDYHVRNGEIQEFVKMLYRIKANHSAGEKTKVGYKDPHGMESATGLVALGRYWPSCRFVVGIRHPVDWFESFYNFHVRVHGPKSLPPPDMLRGACIRGSRGICVQRAKFHDSLALLGKTALTDSEELMLLSKSQVSQARSMSPVPNKLFLYDISQIQDQNQTRKALYMRDLSAFLGLDVSLVDESTEHISRNHGVFLDICDHHYSSLRSALMDVARSASLWIRRYLVQSEDVVVSSPDFFDHAVAGWMEDPCLSR